MIFRRTNLGMISRKSPKFYTKVEAMQLSRAIGIMCEIRCRPRGIRTCSVLSSARTTIRQPLANLLKENLQCPKRPFCITMWHVWVRKATFYNLFRRSSIERQTRVWPTKSRTRDQLRPQEMPSSISRSNLLWAKIGDRSICCKESKVRWSVIWC